MKLIEIILLTYSILLLFVNIYINKCLQNSKSSNWLNFLTFCLQLVLFTVVSSVYSSYYNYIFDIINSTNIISIFLFLF